MVASPESVVSGVLAAVLFVAMLVAFPTEPPKATKPEAKPRRAVPRGAAGPRVPGGPLPSKPVKKTTFAY